MIFVSQVLIGEPVGITETENGEWLVRFADLKLGYIDPRRPRLNRKSLIDKEKQACGRVDNAKARCPQAPQAQQQKTTGA